MTDKPGLGVWASCDDDQHELVAAYAPDPAVDPPGVRGTLCVRCADFWPSEDE